MRTRSGAGWGRLPRAIARALASGNLNWYEGNLMWAIVYKTIAFNKEEDKIPKSQMVELTGINKRHLSRTINSLLKKGVIFRRGNVYGVQTDFSKWENTPNQVYKEKKHLIRAERVPIQGENTPNQVPSRDLSKRAIQEKGLSASQKEKKHEEFKKGFAMMKEVLGKVPGEKK
ncbi:unnamed protein product [marine sediment metagenome]|uniref:Bacteriophage lambda Replication protein O N-terminal domain-containing protein n=1 Tax=marine sediment metagenome TaxID=412755 RepID=X1Q7X5_9ZZZZ